MRPFVLCAILILTMANTAAAQFRAYPRVQVRELMNEETPRVIANPLAGGAFAANLAGAYDVNVEIIQLFITPDIDGWDWYIPLVLTTSPSVAGGAREELAASLAGEAQGVWNLTSSLTREWRGPNTVYDDAGVPHQVRSLTGVWVEGGGQVQGHLAAAGTGVDRNVDLGHTGRLFIAGQGQITLSNDSTLRGAESLAGLLYARVFIGAAHWLDKLDDLGQLLDGSSLDSGYFSVGASVGVFLFDGGALEFAWNRTLGPGVAPLDDGFDLEKPVIRAGFRLVPENIMGIR